MGQVKCGGQECGHLCKAKGSRAEGQNNPRATSSDKHQKEDPAQSKHREDGNKQRKNRREIWHLPKCHPIKPAAQSGEQGNSRRGIRTDTVRRSQSHLPGRQGMGELSTDESRLLTLNSGH